MKIFFYLSTFFVLLGSWDNLRASVLAVVDTGVDINHIDIAPAVWINPLDLAGNDYDEDGNGFLNDVNGWNFAENNEVLIERRYVKYLTPEMKRFFKIQSDMSSGNISYEDIKWAKSQLKDKRFLRSMVIYSNFMHGTHVAGIAVKGTTDARLLTVKLNTAGSSSMLRAKTGEIKSDGMLLKENWRSEEYLLFLVQSHVDMLTDIVGYLDGHNADVANLSFGLSYEHARDIVAEAISYDIFGRRRDIEKMTKALLDVFMVEGRKMVKRAPDTLFVLAAGNEGTNNDLFEAFPANINAENTITVGATFKDYGLASFSNYGAQTVEIAAPGVSIRSAVPGNEYLDVSGTSQAAPLVAKVASMVKDGNPSLSPKQIKKILMETVTKKSFLTDKIVSGGVLHQERAVYAAELSNIMNLDLAIEYSLKEISDPLTAKSNFNPFAEELKDLVLPLPSIFSL